MMCGRTKAIERIKVIEGIIEASLGRWLVALGDDKYYTLWNTFKVNSAHLILKHLISRIEL
jgi:hypothetical protein